jgi:hypothetical protein
LNSDIELDFDGTKCSRSVAELLRSIKRGGRWLYHTAKVDLLLSYSNLLSNIATSSFEASFALVKIHHIISININQRGNMLTAVGHPRVADVVFHPRIR